MTMHGIVSELYPETLSTEYPVSVYYIALKDMFMEQALPHWHPKMEIDFVKSGEALIQIGADTVTVSEGSALLINTNQMHTITAGDSDNTVILSILFHPDFLFDSGESFLNMKYRNPITGNDNFTYCHFTKDTSAGRQGLSSIESILNLNLTKAYGYELMTKSLLCNMWIQLLNAPKNNKLSEIEIIDQQRAKEVIQFIHKHYMAPLSLEDISGSIHLSKSECCRCLKRSLGMTPFEYLMTQRIYISALHMQKDDVGTMSLGELACKCGFNSASYYNKVFRRILGCTPTEYKASIKGKHRDALNPYGISIAKL